MQDLFSKENVLILGTMPNEVYSGYKFAKRLVHDDWAYWGDVKLLMPIYPQKIVWSGY